MKRIKTNLRLKMTQEMLVILICSGRQHKGYIRQEELSALKGKAYSTGTNKFVIVSFRGRQEYIFFPGVNQLIFSELKNSKRTHLTFV